LDVVKGVRYLHGCNIAHGDIKGVSLPTRAKDPTAYLSCSQPNILITDSTPPRAILTDFGFTRVTTISVRVSSEEPGTASFMAPELLLPTRFGLDKGVPSKEADIYALGMTVYQVLTGKWPFFPRREAEVFHAVIAGERPPKPENAERIGMTEVVWNLLRECWREDRTARPNISDILGRFCGITGERRTTDSIIVTAESWEFTEAEVDNDHDLGEKRNEAPGSRNPKVLLPPRGYFAGIVRSSRKLRYRLFG
jgi:serine/threonine protein kinase